MRRTAVLKSVTMMSLTALVVAIGACATSEVGSDDALVNDTSITAPTAETKKVPPPSNPSKSESSTPADAGAKDSGAKDASTSTPADSGTTTGNSLNCDPNDPLIIVKLFTASNPTPCPCSASECCLQGICLPN